MAEQPIKLSKLSKTEDEPTIGRLVAEASRDISTLVQKEIQLAKTELKVSVANGGVGIALFAAAGFLGLLAVIFLSVAIAYFIHWNGSGLDLQWAFLIVFALYALIAGALVLVGIKKLKKVKAPQKTIEQGKQIPKALAGKR